MNITELINYTETYKPHTFGEGYTIAIQYAKAYFYINAFIIFSYLAVEYCYQKYQTKTLLLYKQAFFILIVLGQLWTLLYL